MIVEFHTGKPVQWSKWKVLGCVVSGRDAKGKQLQEHKETIFGIWKFRLIFKWNNKFVER